MTTNMTKKSAEMRVGKSCEASNKFKIVIFDSCSFDVGDICVYPIPGSYPGIVKAIDSTIEYLYYPKNIHREPKEPCSCDVTKFAKSVF